MFDRWLAHLELLEWAAYRMASHALLNWMDDPALLSIVFC